MSKKKSNEPQPSLLRRVWHGLRPFRGLIVVLIGLPMFVFGATISDNVIQIAALGCLMIGGALLGAQYRERQAIKQAEQTILRKIEKKEARKAARRDASTGDDQDDE